VAGRGFGGWVHYTSTGSDDGFERFCYLGKLFMGNCCTSRLIQQLPQPSTIDFRDTVDVELEAVVARALKIGNSGFGPSWFQKTTTALFTDGTYENKYGMNVNLLEV
jgi:hypothetical protein